MRAYLSSGARQGPFGDTVYHALSVGFEAQQSEIRQALAEARRILGEAEPHEDGCLRDDCACDVSYGLSHYVALDASVAVELLSEMFRAQDAMAEALTAILPEFDRLSELD